MSVSPALKRAASGSMGCAAPPPGEARSPHRVGFTPQAPGRAGNRRGVFRTLFVVAGKGLGIPGPIASEVRGFGGLMNITQKAADGYDETENALMVPAPPTRATASRSGFRS